MCMYVCPHASILALSLSFFFSFYFESFNMMIPRAGRLDEKDTIYVIDISLPSACGCAR